MAANKTVKKRPAGVPNIDKDDNFWKQEIDAGVKVASLKPTKNTRDQLTTYMTDVLGRIQRQSDQAIQADGSLWLFWQMIETTKQIFNTDSNS